MVTSGIAAITPPALESALSGFGKAGYQKGTGFTMAEFKYEITERIAVLSQSANGWERQLNMVSWNEREPKYDIRDWSPDGSKMGKGISLSHDEIAILKGILDEMEL